MIGRLLFVATAALVCCAALAILVRPVSAQEPAPARAESAQAPSDDSLSRPARHLLVGVARVPPYAMEAPSANWDGIAVHLWREIADDLDVTYDLRVVDRAALVDQVAAGTLDLALTAVATAEAEGRVDFTQPYHVASLGVARARLDTLGAIAGRLFTKRFLNIVLWLSALLLVVGFLAWLLERRSNAGQFGGDGSPVRGIGAGFWWAGVTMTTIGYGDKAPVTVLGRGLALLWMLVAMGVTASLTAALVSVVATGPGPVTVPEDLRGLSVGAVAGTAVASYLDEERIRYRSFEAAAPGLQAVAEGDIDAFVHEAPVLLYEVDGGQAPTVRVSQTRAAPQHVALAVSEGSDLREPLDRLILEKTSGSGWQSLLKRYMPSRGSQ